MDKKDPPKTNLPATSSRVFPSLASAKTLLRLTNEIIASQKKAPPSPDLLYESVSRGDVAEVNRLIAAGADVNAIGKYGQPALMSAALNGHAEIVKLLLSAGANPNWARNDGHTALMDAAFLGDAAVVKLLLSAGANPKAKDENGWTVLYLASIMRNSDVMLILQAAGAKE